MSEESSTDIAVAGEHPTTVAISNLLYYRGLRGSLRVAPSTDGAPWGAIDVLIEGRRIDRETWGVLRAAGIDLPLWTCPGYEPGRWISEGMRVCKLCDALEDSHAERLCGGPAPTIARFDGFGDPCRRPSGHDGEHDNGGYEWDTSAPEPEASEQSTSSAIATSSVEHDERCVSCVCGPAPEMGADGCASCGGNPLSVAILHGVPHVCHELEPAEAAAATAIIAAGMPGDEEPAQVRTLLSTDSNNRYRLRVEWDRDFCLFSLSEDRLSSLSPSAQVTKSTSFLLTIDEMRWHHKAAGELLALAEKDLVELERVVVGGEPAPEGK